MLTEKSHFESFIMKPIILASASPRRRELFSMMEIPCTIDPSGIDEKVDPALTPGEIVCSLAKQKAVDVAVNHQQSVIVSADTIVVLEGRILGKPADAAEAAEMLRSLSARSHYVYSGVFVLNQQKKGEPDVHISFFERTKVTFSTLDDLEIERYIKSGRPMDKAGAYGIQDDYGSLFIKKIDGDYYNVVGFPVNKFYQTLKKEHKKLFKSTFRL